MITGLTKSDGQHRDSNKVIQGLWVGPELSVMERLSISSFIMNGHNYHLYVYCDVGGIPAGTVVKDANEILPYSMVFQYKDRKTYAGFSNYFRYKLLLEKGGWWADSDLICLKHFDFDEEYVFSREPWHDEEVINCGAIKVPPGSDVMAYAWEVCQRKRTDELVWGEVGPRLMAEAVRKFSLEKFSKPGMAFCPLPNCRWDEVLNPDMAWEFGESTYAIHLWNELWRKNNKDKNRQYHPNCLYEVLKGRFLRS